MADDVRTESEEGVKRLSEADIENIRRILSRWPSIRLSDKMIFGKASAGLEVQEEKLTTSIEEVVREANISEERKEEILKEWKEYKEAASDERRWVLEQQRLEFEEKLKDQASKRWARWFGRDFVAVVIGAALLFILGISILWMIPSGHFEPRVIESAFLILLGFFFGQKVLSKD